MPTTSPWLSAPSASPSLAPTISPSIDDSDDDESEDASDGNDANSDNKKDNGSDDALSLSNWSLIAAAFGGMLLLCILCCAAYCGCIRKKRADDTVIKEAALDTMVGNSNNMQMKANDEGEVDNASANDIDVESGNK